MRRARRPWVVAAIFVLSVTPVTLRALKIGHDDAGHRIKSVTCDAAYLRAGK